MGQRPPHLKPSAHWKLDPAPEPEPVAAAEEDPLGLDPTRYGDWALKGIAVDF
jgi:hypothetical protein